MGWRNPTNVHNRLDILQVKDLFRQEISTFVCNYFQGNVPDGFTGYYQTLNHQYGTRRNLNLIVIPRCKTELGKKTVKVLGSKIWNDLGQDIKDISNPKAFRKAIKMVYLNILPRISLPPTSQKCHIFSLVHIIFFLFL